MAIKPDEIYEIMTQLVFINERLYKDKEAYPEDVFDAIAGNIDTAYGAMSGTATLLRKRDIQASM